MHRQISLALGALAACAVMAIGAALLRNDILSFSAWPHTSGDADAPQLAIPLPSSPRTSSSNALVSTRHGRPVVRELENPVADLTATTVIAAAGAPATGSPTSGDG